LGAYKALNKLKYWVYDRYKLQISTFLNLFKTQVLALDLSAKISRGDVPLFDSIYFGGYRTLRGIHIGEYIGNHSIVLSCEYRIPLNLVARSSRREQFLGSAIYLFSDFGILEPTKKDLKLENAITNAGLGFAWLVTKDAILRFDLSFTPKFRLTISSGWKF